MPVKSAKHRVTRLDLVMTVLLCDEITRYLCHDIMLKYELSGSPSTTAFKDPTGSTGTSGSSGSTGSGGGLAGDQSQGQSQSSGLDSSNTGSGSLNGMGTNTNRGMGTSTPGSMGTDATGGMGTGTVCSHIFSSVLSR